MRGLSNTITKSRRTAEELEAMHALYRQGGQERNIAPQIVYGDDNCPHPGCTQRMQAIDFPLASYGPVVHDPLVRSWWSDVGFVGRCPQCSGWIHFPINGKQAVPAEAAEQLPHLPDDWHAVALIL
jgi:hypothetical protein